ncbi:MAG: DUF1573 domain-containing protein [Candidatus Hydrogenedentota bacterium]
MIRCGAMALAFFVTFSAAGQLQWDTQESEHYMEPGQERVKTTFSFQNVGDDPVTIERISSTCGCTVPDLEQRRYEAGESGEIEAVFVAGELTGRQASRIIVRTDYQNSPTHVLRMVVHVPEILRLSTNTLTWGVAGEAEAKTIEVRSGLDELVHVTSVESSTDLIEADLEEVEPGALYRITARPRDTSKPVFGVIRIMTDYPPDDPAVWSAHARVLPQEHIGRQEPVRRAAGADDGEASSGAAEQPTVTLEPRMVVWRRQDGAEPKRIHVRIDREEGGSLEVLTRSNENFFYTLEEEEKGRHYILTITPLSTETPARTVFQFEPGADVDASAPIAAVAAVLDRS